MKKLISKNFITEFASSFPEHLLQTQRPLQIYRLADIAPYLNLPTPSFNPKYNLFIYLHSGTINLSLNSKMYTVKENSLLKVTYGELMSLDNISASIDGYILLIEHKVISGLLEVQEEFIFHFSEPIILLKKNKSEWYARFITLFYEEAYSNAPIRKIYLGLLQAYLYQWLAITHPQKNISRQKEIALNFKTLISKYYKQHKKLEFYADALHITLNYLNRSVKNSFLQTAKQMLHQYIILQAQLLLWDQTLSIKEVCNQLNIEDSSYFIRSFKKTTGMTPKQYQKKIART
ncbi:MULTISPECIES: AraC family transcriptional regulator [Chryseobacterium]|uniref:helix-turn-helix domain-containing protein n=1 Tax=Chryseobacterium TaxID=59732 RepID=UPI0016239D27|nr:MULTISPECIES: helix-turn-helix domain-containing protein [Chryseobacterium]MDM1556204.1 AraC family transcriptional regulator [Chryseobacterium indologenes]